MPKFCLNSIVKNEVENLPRMLQSVAPYLDYYAILDTGSTDGTPELIKKFFDERGIPGIVGHGEFKNFSQARNDALQLARDNYKGDGYFLLVDADMELVAERILPVLNLPAYALLQRAGGLAYYNARMVHPKAAAEYLGSTHEYLSVEPVGQLTEWYFIDHATGSNRKDKLTRDYALLSEEHKENPKKPRPIFYLAQTLKEMGKHKAAMQKYHEHRTVADWDEEKWFSLYAIAQIKAELKETDDYVRTLEAAINERPQRPEPYYDLAKHYRVTDRPVLSWMYADAGSKLPPCGDLLFLDTNPATWGFTDEKAITGFYQPHTRMEAFRCCNKLALQKECPQPSREQARSNLMHYIRPLGEMVKSWNWQTVPFVAPKPRYTAMNPSITVHNDKILVLTRTVNYVIRPDGSYDMQGDDAIKTTNYIVPLTDDLRPDGDAVEIKRPDDLPAPVYPPVLGFEDMRLISLGEGLWSSATVREQNTEGVCEQWISAINADGSTTARKMNTPARYGKQYEKNWMPLVDGTKIKFMYRPGVVIDYSGRILSDKEPAIAWDSLSGGSHLIFWEAGWLGIVHEARMDPAFGYSKRYYQHRVVWYDANFVLQKVSLPFFFERRQIEYCAGLARHPRANEFLLSYSTNDATAKIGRISIDDMRSLLWAL